MYKGVNHLNGLNLSFETNFQAVPLLKNPGGAHGMSTLKLATDHPLLMLLTQHS